MKGLTEPRSVSPCKLLPLDKEQEVEVAVPVETQVPPAQMNFSRASEGRGQGRSCCLRSAPLREALGESVATVSVRSSREKRRSLAVLPTLLDIDQPGTSHIGCTH
jgi:hypothetical protein